MGFTMVFESWMAASQGFNGVPKKNRVFHER